MSDQKSSADRSHGPSSAHFVPQHLSRSITTTQPNHAPKAAYPCCSSISSTLDLLEESGRQAAGELLGGKDVERNGMDCVLTEGAHCASGRHTTQQGPHGRALSSSALPAVRCGHARAQICLETATSLPSGPSPDPPRQCLLVFTVSFGERRLKPSPNWSCMRSRELAGDGRLFSKLSSKNNTPF